MSEHRAPTDSTLLGREPALWAAAIRAVLYAAVLFGLDLSDAQLAGGMVAVEAILALVTRTQVTPNAAVVERETHGEVIAGPANDQVEPGTSVRDA